MKPLLIAVALSAMPLVAAQADDHDWPLDTDATVEQALEVARGAGVVLVQSIDFDDGIWEVEGRNSAGAKLDVDINAATRAIVTR